jgi:hypothetical protein
MACSSIRAGERLLSIPEQLLLTPEAALQASAAGSLLQKADLSDWSILGLLLAETRCQGPAPSNKWGPYIACLPAHSGGILEWSEEEVHSHPQRFQSCMGTSCVLQPTPAPPCVQVHMLRGSPTAWLANMLRVTFGAACATLDEVIADAQQQGLLQPAVDGAALRWAFSMLASRLVRLDMQGSMEALVPWGDMLNHSTSARCFLGWDPATRTVVLEADQPYAQGEQVCAHKIPAACPSLFPLKFP